MFDLRCTLITPEKTVCDQRAEFVVVPFEDGEKGIAPGHAAMVGRLGCGELRIRDFGRVERYYVEGGFVEVADNVVSVTTPRALRADEIDEAVVRTELFAALSRHATTPEAIAHRDELVKRSRAQLRIARRER